MEEIRYVLKMSKMRSQLTYNQRCQRGSLIYETGTQGSDQGCRLNLRVNSV